MAGETNPEALISQTLEHRTSITIPGWASFLLVFALVGVLLSLPWHIAERSFVAPYYEYKYLGPVSLAPAVQNVQAQVEYPRRISPDDRGIEHGKRIIVRVVKTTIGPAEPVYLAVKPLSGHIRFLTEEGHDASGQLVITATYSIANLGSLYVEHPNVPSGRPISLTIEVLPPTGTITRPVSGPGLSFVIEEESLVAGTVREVADLIPWQTLLVSLLALPGTLLKALWDRNKKLPDLYGKIQQAWEEGHIDDIRGLYKEYQGMKFYVSLRGMVIDTPGHIEIELLYRRAEARFHFEQARKALQRKATWEARKHLDRALEWDPIYENIRILDEKTQELKKKYQETGDPAVWWLDPVPDVKKHEMLIALLEDRERTQPEVRGRIVSVLGHINTRVAKDAVDRMMRQDTDLSVQAQAAWMLAQRLRPEKTEGKELKVAGPRSVKEWLEAFPSPLVYNPFQANTAEADDFLGRHFFEHPAYRRLLDYGSQHVAIFADLGGGKTSCRRMFKFSLDSPPHLIIEYTNFGGLVQDAAKISVEAHVQGILRQASGMLSIALPPPGNIWQEQVICFLEQVRSRGYTAVYVLVDNVRGYAETQTSSKIATLLLRHLVGDLDLLDLTNRYVSPYAPDLYFKFCLPSSLKERLLQKYGGFTTGRIKIVDMTWQEDLLQEALKVRLQAASSSRRKVDSLMAFTDEYWPIDLNSSLIGLARGSPRRLIALVNMLFQHRAQTWHKGGRRPHELYITMADWAALLEHLLRQGSIR